MPEPLYIPRQQAEEFVSEFAQAVEKPSAHAIVLHVWGTGGVGKSTLLRRLKSQNQQRVVFVEVSFGVTEGIDNPIKLMKKLYDELERQAPTPTGLQRDLLAKPDSFLVRYDEYFDTLHQLQTQPTDGKGTVSDEQIKQVKQLANLGASAAGQLVLPGVAAAAVGSAAEATVDAARMALSEKDRIVQLIQQHKATKKKRALQELMLEPVPKLTQAFVDTLRQRSKKQPIALVFDTYEKAPAELDLWLWRSFLGNHDLQADAVRVVVAGRNLLTNQEGWRKLNQDRHILNILSLGRFDLEQTEKYLHEIGITNPSEVEVIYQETKGLPYYLDWIRDRIASNQPIDFSKGGREVVDLLLQGLDETNKAKEKKVLQWTACCRWFNRSLIQYLIAHQEPLDDQRDWFNWLEQQHFVEFAQGICRLDDVARAVFRLSFYQESINDFRRAHELLADYFEEQASQEVLGNDNCLEKYNNLEWCQYTAESLYYLFFSKENEGRQKLVSHLFAGSYLSQVDIVKNTFVFIVAESNIKNNELLSNNARNFISDVEFAIVFGWSVLDKAPDAYEFDIENVGSIKPQIENSIDACLKLLNSLDGLARYVGLVCKSLRCPLKKRMQLLLKAQAQADILVSSAHPEFSCSLFWKVGAFINELGYEEESLKSCEKALKIDPDNSIALFNKGVALGRLGRHEEALTVFNKALEIRPEHTLSWLNQGSAFYQLGQYESAADSFSKALNIESDYSLPCVRLGDTLIRLGRLRDALKIYDEFLKLQPSDDSVCYSRGIVLSRLGQSQEALISFEKVLQAEQNDPSVWDSRGVVLRRLGRYQEALSSHNKALEIQSNYSTALANRGSIFACLGFYDKASADLDEALRIQSDDPSVFYAMAYCALLQGHTDMVIDNLEKAIELNPIECREEAKNNCDFDSVRGDARFQALIGEAS